LLFGVHMHQPVGNFGDAVDEAVRLCYRPFFEVMVKYPQFKFSVHCSGWLLDKIKDEYPDIFKNMQTLTKSNSIEWISAGYYEPVLSSIPSKDRVKQIKKLNSFIKEHFNQTPKGLWLTERVWESSLVKDLKKSDIEFSIVDDYHFLSSGFQQEQMGEYFITEEGAEELALFPISQSLRYAIPFFTPQKAIESIKDFKGRSAIIFDDAEKFGLWPKTYEWVYEKGWLEEFVQLVLDDDEIVTQQYFEHMQNNRASSLAYLGSASYFEMGEWSLKPYQSKAMKQLLDNLGNEYFNTLGVSFVKGGIWKNFFIKYIESNYLHKRMLYWSKKADMLTKELKDSLYKLQTNDVFWHGVFGGLYLPNLRDNAYRYLLELESSQKIKKEILDIDKDGFDELKLKSKDLSVVISAKNGASMVEFGSLKLFFNWQNTLMRREEAYHEKIFNPPKQNLSTTADDGISTIHNEEIRDEDITLRDEIVYDWHPKFSFIEHFSNKNFTLEEFKKISFCEVGDFANQPFEMLEDASFVRDGGIYLENSYDAVMSKSYALKQNRLKVETTFSTSCDKQLFCATELNLHFAHPDLITINGAKIGDGIVLRGVDEIAVFDEFTNKNLILKLSDEADIYSCVVYTVSQNESGFEKVAQGISFYVVRDFIKSFEMRFELGVCDV